MFTTLQSYSGNFKRDRRSWQHREVSAVNGTTKTTTKIKDSDELRAAVFLHTSSKRRLGSESWSPLKEDRRFELRALPVNGHRGVQERGGVALLSLHVLSLCERRVGGGVRADQGQDPSGFIHLLYAEQYTLK